MAYLELQNLYTEDITEEELKQQLEKSNLTYAYIIHDKDITEEGELKKPHFHCFVEIPYNPHKTTIQLFQETETYINILEKSKRLYLQPIKNIKAFTQYLIHKNETNKYKYQKEEIKTNREDFINEMIEATLKDAKISTEDFLQKLEDYATGLTKDYFTYREIRQFAKDMKKLAYFIQYQSRIITDLQYITGKCYFTEDPEEETEEDK